jgi:glycerol-3-phosphate dehydrogenase (NAD(P)+)
MVIGDSVVVVGGGSWGTALAMLLAAKGYDTTLWAREPEVVEAISTRRENQLFLPGVVLPETLTATGDLTPALAEAETIVSAVPTQFIRSVFAPQVAAIPFAKRTVVTVSKGIEVETLMTPNEIFGELSPGLEGSIVALSGPSFAREVAAGNPTAVVAASRDIDRAHRVQSLFATEAFRVYASDDVVSVELGGALKNVVAIAAGIAEGMGFGHNTMAALITRGVAEITRLGVARGGNPLTFAGLSGMGDLVLTCTGGLSRNRSVGVELGKGRSLQTILDDMHMVAEGVKTTLAARTLAHQLGIEMPITEQVYAVLYESKDPGQAVHDLMVRTLKDERA